MGHTLQNLSAKSDRPAVLIIASKWWPAASRLALALIRCGCQVDALSPRGHSLSHVPDLGRFFPLRGRHALQSLDGALAQGSGYDMLLPADDEAVVLLRAFHAAHPKWRDLIEKSMSPPHSLPLLTDRMGLIDRATQLGLLAPKTAMVSSEAELVQWLASHPNGIVVKKDLSCGGTGVRIARTEDEARLAWRSLSVRTPWLSAMRQWLIEGEPLALWMRRQELPGSVSVQEYIEGRPANMLMLCDRGQVIAQVGVLVVESRGKTGPATIVRRTDRTDMAEAGRRIAAALELSGLHGLDFVVEQSSGRAFLIELNPRFTQIGHLTWTEQASLVKLLAQRLGATDAVSDRGGNPTSDLIAFFPHLSEERFLASPWHHLGLRHDVPQDAEDLIAELVRPIAPKRSLMYRAYTRLRPPQNQKIDLICHESPEEI